MLFVNEEFEESHPVFSEPKKVHPETDDEMARRIKNMLGEYEPKEDFTIDDCEEPMITQVENMFVHSSKNEIFESPEQKKNEDVLVEVIKEKHADLSEEPEIIETGIKDTVQPISIDSSNVSKDAKNSPNSSTETSVNSRRCSLKRQCKDKISLLDYNPMLTIRTLKRPRINSSSKGKNFENLDIPTLKKYPDIQTLDCSSEVPDQDPPLLLNASLSIFDYESPNDEMIKKEDMYKCNSKSNNSIGIFKRKEISKKQSKKKKKKKVLYESLPISEETALSKSAQELNKHSSDSNVGPCEIKNGILKIRLSKLPDYKKDNYEVSFCETNVPNNVKKLSVPLSPQTPILNSYEKKHSSKRALKKQKQYENDNCLINTNCKNNSFDNSEQLKTGSYVNQEASKVKIAETKCANEIEENGIFQVTENSFISEKQCTDQPPILLDSTLENHLGSLTSNNEPFDLDPKILCSINLSLINRLPVKASPSNSSDPILCMNLDNIVEDKKLSSAPENIIEPQSCLVLDETSNKIKKEVFTPTASDFKCLGLHSLENENSPHRILQGHFNQDDSCPNLTPAYSFEASNIEGSCNTATCATVPDAQGSSLDLATPDLTSDHQKVDLEKSSSLFPHPQLNKIKIEVPEAIL